MLENLKHLPLKQMHRDAGAKFAPFAGYDMPVQYPLGVLKEHLHTREKAGLFDVSHMGQLKLRALNHETLALALERLVPGDILNLPPGRSRYSVFLNEAGGVLDDLMITRPLDRDGELFLVVNAAVKEADIAFLKTTLPSDIKIDVLVERCLLALQGPEASGILHRLIPQTDKMPFMSSCELDTQFGVLIVNRAGYTGEDGFEISVTANNAHALAEQLVANDTVEWIGLGARDSLRLEAGLCLYGHDMTPETTPVAANIAFTIGKRRKELSNFPGADRILAEIEEGTQRKRVGIKPEGRAPVREGAEIFNLAGVSIGSVTSGGFGPSAAGPVAMGYVDRCYTPEGSKIQISLRNKLIPATVIAMPVIAHRYFRGEK